jgi:hypothetical protein
MNKMVIPKNPKCGYCGEEGSESKQIFIDSETFVLFCSSPDCIAFHKKYRKNPQKEKTGTKWAVETVRKILSFECDPVMG